MLPTYSDVEYGQYKKNRLDVYMADAPLPTPVVVYFHGGGFCRNNKVTALPEPLLMGCLNAGISVVSANYRLSQDAPYPAAMLDSVRALQFVRNKAEEFGFDADRVALSGRSAGAIISFWIGYRPDLAKEDSTDPVERQTTAVRCLAVVQAQSTVDLRLHRSLFPAVPEFPSPQLLDFFGLSAEQIDTEEAIDLFVEASALEQIEVGAPPTIASYFYPALTTAGEVPYKIAIHHSVFGRLLKRKMESVGAECVLRVREDFSEDLSEDEVLQVIYREQVRFLAEHVGAGER